MDLTSRINNIQPYFVSFNVMAEESAAYAVVRFPSHWTLPDTNALKTNFKIEIAAMQNNQLCFVTEIKNGSECLFDALDYVIDFNKKVEERKGLLDEKIKELGNLFATETLDRLKTLKFTFEPQKKGAKKSSQKKTEQVAESQAEQVEAEPSKTEEKQNPDENSQDSSLMSLAKGLTGE